MRVWWILAVLIFAAALRGQQWFARPEFQAHQVGAASGGQVGWLFPEEIYSIYGQHLGPEQGCDRDVGGYKPQGPNPPGEYDRLVKTLPTSLCDVMILLDEEPVPLIYVQARQINFLVLRAVKPRDKVMLRLVYRGMSTIPVALKFGPDRIVVSQVGEAFVGMPIWVRVWNASEPRRPVQLRVLQFDSFGDCPYLEVEFEGVRVPERGSMNPRRQFDSGRPCPASSPPDRESLRGRAPLHLLYKIERAGIYRVRYVPGRIATLTSGPALRVPARAEAPSEWAIIVVKPGTAAKRATWFAARVAAAPTDQEQLVYDFLPSIFGYGDAEALRIGLKYLNNPDPVVAGWAAAFLREYYPAATLRETVKPVR